jgi:hypothetical protein
MPKRMSNREIRKALTSGEPANLWDSPRPLPPEVSEELCRRLAKLTPEQVRKAIEEAKIEAEKRTAPFRVPFDPACLDYWVD